MMNKKQTSKLSIVKYTLLVPVVGMLVFFNTALRMQAGSVESTGSNVWVETLTAVEASDVPGLDFQAPPPPPLKKEAKKEPKEKVIVRDLVQKETDEPKKNGSAYDYAEEMPNFPGGDKAMTKFLFDNMQYPVVAQESNIQGRVIVRFVVADDGSITDVEIKQSLHPVCDAEAIRVVKKMPKWTPGKIKGQVVAVYYTLPILFKLSGGEKKDTTPTPLKDGIYSLNGKNISISGDHIIVSEDSITVSRMVPQRDTPLRTVSDEVVVMIDGKVVPNTELNALDPNSIENITVLKEPKPGRVIITLKK
jgi:TonB family protein